MTSAVAGSSSIMAVNPPKSEANTKASGVMTEKSRASSTEACKQTPTSASEVEMVQCECCGLVEECTPAYIAHVRGLYCGRWVCGLCAEAVKDERGRAGGGGGLEESLEDALRAHMSFCMEFNNSERTSPVVHIAAVMRKLLRRNLEDGSAGSRSAPGSPRRVPISRSSSCMTSLPRPFTTSL